MTQSLTRGDVVVQRGTNHAWRNPSTSEWVRMIYGLQECQEIKIGENVLVEKLELEKSQLAFSASFFCYIVQSMYFQQCPLLLPRLGIGRNGTQQRE